MKLIPKNKIVTFYEQGQKFSLNTETNKLYRYNGSKLEYMKTIKETVIKIKL